MDRKNIFFTWFCISLINQYALIGRAIAFFVALFLKKKMSCCRNWTQVLFDMRQTLPIITGLTPSHELVTWGIKVVRSTTWAISTTMNIYLQTLFIQLLNSLSGQQKSNHWINEHSHLQTKICFSNFCESAFLILISVLWQL